MKMTHRAKNLISIAILLLAIVLLVVFIIDPNLLSRRVPGSFEGRRDEEPRGAGVKKEGK